MTRLYDSLQPTEVWQQREDLIRRFEAAWLAGQRPAPDDYLPETAADRGAVLLELVHADLEFRLQAGEAARVETYLQRYPPLSEESDAVLGLLAAEYEQRRRREPGLDTEEYYRRFPQYRTALEQRLAPALGPPSTQELETAFGDGGAAVEDAGSLPPTSRYELVEEIARGGMGAVWRARDRNLGRPLAVKVLLEQGRGHPELVRRFRAEARVTGQLQHPGIPPVHEVGALPDGRPFFALKLIQGRTLAALLEERGGPADGLPRFLNVFAQVCQAVAYAHSRGVIHRDLKPSNVMVGAFGEVQVMDWGLAKVLTPASGGRPPPVAPLEQGADAPRSLAEQGAYAPRSPAGQTQAGTVLGTPAYMAPEQARGEVGSLDERCDVFGLGAILCQILTAAPPYTGLDTTAVLGKARAADLTEAADRLQGCGADAELVRLAGDCLAPDPDLRPRHGEAVAEAVTAYLAEVQERLRAAELARAASQARADAEAAKARAERRRRRLALALVAALLALMTGAGVAGWWYWQGKAEQARQEAIKELRRVKAEEELRVALAQVAGQRHELHQQLKDPLRASELLSKIEAWRNLVDRAQAAVQRAEVLADSHPDVLSAELLGQVRIAAAQVKRDDRDWQMVKRLDDIRLEAATLVEGKWNLKAVGPKIRVVFDELGLAVTAGNPARVAGPIRQSPLRYALVAALDYWAAVLVDDTRLRPHLLQVARLADPDPWRDQVRDPNNWRDKARLQQLAKQTDPAGQSPQVVLLLAYKLYRDGGVAAPLLRRALLHHPTDFWLHLELGELVQEPRERIGCYQAALALRPRASVVHLNWGGTLAEGKDYAGAIAHYRQALRFDPKNASAHHNWGCALTEGKDYAGAVAHFQQALRLDPKFANAHFGWGNALSAGGDLAGAIAHYREALRLDPQDASVHYNWGLALLKRKDYAGAVAHFQQALRLEPKLANAHHSWGNALRKQGNLAGAIAHYQEALRLDPKLANAHYSWGNALRMQGHLLEAIVHYREALRLDPQDARVHNNLGVTLMERGDFVGAIAHFQQALRLDPKFADASHNWGTALLAQQEFAAAAARFQQVLLLDPRRGRTHLALGEALLEQGQFTAAQKAIAQGKALFPPGHPWHDLAQEKLQICERLLLLDRKLSAVLDGQAKPKDAAEQLALAVLCRRYKKQYAAAARFYKDALTGEPKLAARNRYPAASAAVLAAAGQGEDAVALEEDDKAPLRRQALDWLRADLSRLGQKLQAETQAAPLVCKTLEHWQQNPDLASVRAAQVLAQLPAAERKAWAELWSAVGALLQKARAAAEIEVPSGKWQPGGQRAKPQAGRLGCDQTRTTPTSSAATFPSPGPYNERQTGTGPPDCHRTKEPRGCPPRPHLSLNPALSP